MKDELEELQRLTAAWQEQKPVRPAGLARTSLVAMVKRQGMWLRIHMAVALALAGLFLGGSLWAAIHFGSVEFVVFAIGVWMLTLFALLFQLQNRAEIWSPESETTEAFLRLSVRRCHASLRGIRFGLWLLLAEVVLLVSWHAWYWSSRPERPAVSEWLLAATLPLAFLIGLLILRSKRRSELARLEMIQRELSD